MAHSRQRIGAAIASAGLEYTTLVGPWIARLVLAYPQLSALVQDEVDDAIPVREALGIRVRAGRVDKARVKRTALPLSQLEHWNGGAARYPLIRNVGMLAEVADLTVLDQKILAFAALAMCDPALREFALRLANCSDFVAFRAVATALRCRLDDIARALARGSALVSTGLLSMEREPYSLAEKLLLRKGLGYVLLESHASLNELLEQFFDVMEQSRLTAQSFPHLEMPIALLVDYLRKCRSDARRGVNVLLYGPTGTGKTELAKVIAGAAGMTLYAVKSADAELASADADERLGSYMLCQRFLERHPHTLVLFDEMQDIFPGLPVTRRAEQWRCSKAWMNNLLENNVVPTIWITNDTSDVDDAYLRRFDYSLKMEIPPRSVRERILREAMRDTNARESVITLLAENTALSPAIVERAVKVAGTVDNGSAGHVEHVVQEVLARTMQLMRVPSAHKENQESNRYRLDYLNPDCDLHEVVVHLRDCQGRCAILLHGPPGTGKSAFSRHLARTLDRPLHARSASDLLSPYVGETEQGIARMFYAAKRDDAVVLIDEVDSFLGERAAMRYSWEVTAVSEMLTQIDSHGGVVICTTNRIESLDSAALRRFVFKIKLDYLSREQKRQIFIESQTRDNDASVLDDCFTQLDRMRNVTVADFETVRQRAALLRKSMTPCEFMAALAAECATKNDQVQRTIGFMS